jgi:DNA repair exonuclease SbcCD ATPase subunit
MRAEQMLRYLSDQRQMLQELVNQLDEIQIQFNAQYDSFKAQHDATLDRVTQKIANNVEAVRPDLRAAIRKNQQQEQDQIGERLQKVANEYLPKRLEAADALMKQAEAERNQLRTLNPQLDQQEEELKQQRAELASRLAELNTEIKAKSRGLGVILHFIAINNADRERQRIIGKLEALEEALYSVRQEWDQRREEAEQSQSDLQQRWQLESIAVARLRTELDQLQDPAHREELSLLRAVRRTLDSLKEPVPDSELGVDLRQMVELNIQTDDYHEALAAVGGLIGLLRGIDSGLQAINQSVESLVKEQEMHSAYLGALSFSLSDRTRAFHSQWPGLVKEFSDENLIGEHPARFAATIQPLLQAPLSQSSIESMFEDLGASITKATASWQ